MSTGQSARGAAAGPLDLAKHDRTVVLGDRTIAVRAYLDRRAPDGPGWHATIVENRTPVDHALAPTDDPEACLAAAVRFLTAMVASDVANRRQSEEWESEGGALIDRIDRGHSPSNGTGERAAS